MEEELWDWHEWTDETKGQLRDNGQGEAREAELLGPEGGPAAWGPGTACKALGRPERQTGRPHGLQH